jgi:hypothetical protein
MNLTEMSWIKVQESKNVFRFIPPFKSYMDVVAYLQHHLKELVQVGELNGGSIEVQGIEGEAGKMGYYELNCKIKINRNSPLPW